MAIGETAPTRACEEDDPVLMGVGRAGPCSEPGLASGCVATVPKEGAGPLPSGAVLVSATSALPLLAAAPDEAPFAADEDSWPAWSVFRMPLVLVPPLRCVDEGGVTRGGTSAGEVTDSGDGGAEETSSSRSGSGRRPIDPSARLNTGLTTSQQASPPPAVSLPADGTQPGESADEGVGPVDARGAVRTSAGEAAALVLAGEAQPAGVLLGTCVAVSPGEASGAAAAAGEEGLLMEVSRGGLHEVPSAELGSGESSAPGAGEGEAMEGRHRHLISLIGRAVDDWVVGRRNAKVWAKGARRREEGCGEGDVGTVMWPESRDRVGGVACLHPLRFLTTKATLVA